MGSGHVGWQGWNRPGLIHAERHPLGGQNGRPDFGKLTARLDTQANARTEVIKGRNTRGITGSGNHSRRAESFRDRTGEPVGTTRVRPRDRNSERERLVYAHHTRIGGLRREQRRDQPYGGGDREEADDLVAFPESAGNRPGRRFRIRAGTRPGSGEPRRSGAARRGNRDQADHRRFPQSTKTGLAAASRIDPPGSAASLDACSAVPSTS